MFVLIASAKSRSARGASHQPVFMGSWLFSLAICHTCLPCLPSGSISPTCVLLPLMIGLMRNDGSVNVFLVSMVLFLWEVAVILGNDCGIQGQNYVAWLQGSKMPVRDCFQGGEI